MGQRSQLRLGAPAEFPQDMEREPGVQLRRVREARLFGENKLFFFTGLQHLLKQFPRLEMHLSAIKVRMRV